MSRFAIEDQLAAACTVYPYRASRLLNFFDPKGFLNEVPSHGAFRKQFSFTHDQLIRYIEQRSLAEEIIGAALDQRSSPNPYVESRGSTWVVGWFDGTRRSRERGFDSAELAAAEYVLRFWGLPSLSSR